MGRPMLIPPAEWPSLARKYQAGGSLTSLSGEYQVGYNSVRNALLKHGVILRPAHVALHPRGNTKSKGASNVQWTGDAATYNARHLRVKTARGKCEGPCQHCGASETAFRFEWAQTRGTTGTDPGHYIALCRPCHEDYDATLTREQVEEIKALAYFGVAQYKLAKMHQLSQSYVSLTINGKSRKASPALYCEMGD